MKPATIAEKLEALAYCVDRKSYEDVAGHLCDLLEFCRQQIVTHDGMMMFANLEAMTRKYGATPWPAMSDDDLIRGWMDKAASLLAQAVADRDAARAEATRLVVEVAKVGHDRTRLVEALRPFADQANIIDSQRQDGEKWHDAAWFRFGASVTAITVGDCRRAAALVAEMDAAKEPIKITAVTTPAGYLRAGEKLMQQIQDAKGADHAD